MVEYALVSLDQISLAEQSVNIVLTMLISSYFNLFTYCLKEILNSQLDGRNSILILFYYVLWHEYAVLSFTVIMSKSLNYSLCRFKHNDSFIG